MLSKTLTIVKAMVITVVMYRCESWTIKKAERLTLHAFELWCWTRFLRVPWAAKRSNQSILKEKNPWVFFIGRTDAEAETPILWPRDVKSWLAGKDPDAGRLRAGGKGGDRGQDGWMASPTQWTWVWANSGRQWRTEKPGVLQIRSIQHSFDISN